MIKYSLFEDSIEQIICSQAVDIREICAPKEQSLEWLKSKTHRISVDAKDIFDYFFEKNEVPLSEFPQYYVSPYWGEASGNYKFRYMIIKDCGVNILICFRIVGIIYSSMYFCISYKILSDQPKHYDTNRVLNALKKIDCIKKIEVFTDASTEWDYANFYCTEDGTCNLSKSRRKQRRASLKLLESGVEMKIITHVDSYILAKMNELFDNFESQRFKFNRRATIKMADMCAKVGHVFTWWLNDKIIGLQIVCNDFVNIASIHSAKDITTFQTEFISEVYTNSDVDFAKKNKKPSWNITRGNR